VSVEAYLRSAPKAELHVHLEGSIQPATLLKLAERNRVELPATTERGVREWFTYRDFDHFIEIYVTISRCLASAEDYELISYELGEELAAQNVQYAEVTFTPSTHGISRGVPHDTYFRGLAAGRKRVRDTFGIEISWVFDMEYKVANLERARQVADYTLGAALDGKNDGVVALGLGGVEIGHSFEHLAPYFERARAAGLHAAPHAGEIVGPENIWGAIQVLGAERIGHGVRAIEDPALVRYLARRGIPLEVCPTSNIRLGVFPSLAEHPLRALYAAGVAVTVNSDDPPLFNTTLTQELLLLHEPFGFDLAAIDDIVLNGVRHSFIDATWKQEREASFLADLACLNRQTLGTRVCTRQCDGEPPVEGKL
jgi:aminodeoxyfutalosine deaminase